MLAVVEPIVSPSFLRNDTDRLELGGEKDGIAYAKHFFYLRKRLDEVFEAFKASECIDGVAFFIFKSICKKVFGIRVVPKEIEPVVAEISREQAVSRGIVEERFFCCSTEAEYVCKN